MKKDSKIWRNRIAQWAGQTDRAYMLALRTTGSAALAEEAVQEAYIRLLKHPPEDRGEEAAASYFLRTVHGVAVDLARSNKSRRLREENHRVNREQEAPSAEDLATTAEAARAARAALLELDREEREAVCLCCEQNLSRRTAAYVLNEPEQTVVDRMQRGLEKLRSRLTAQGFASLTPVMLGQSLRDLGVPPAPVSLVDKLGALGKTAQKGLKTARKSLRMSAKSAGSASGPVAVVASMAVAAAAVIWFSTRPTPAPAPAVPLAPANLVLPVAQPTPPPVTPAIEAPLTARWHFTNGPAADLKVVSGTWTWQAGAAGAPGMMVIPEGTTRVLLPTAIPARPLCVTVKLHWSFPAQAGRARWVSSAAWSDGRQLIAAPFWVKTWAGGKQPGAYDVEHYFIDRSVFQVPVDHGVRSVVVMEEHTAAYPAKMVCLNFVNAGLNFTIDEILLRTLRPEEIPAELKNPEALKGVMTAYPAEK